MLIHDHASHLNQSYEHACAYVAALVQGDPDTVVIDARAIHDVRKDVAAIPRRGTLRELWNELVAWNNLGFGIFVNISEMDGIGREIANVKTIRCQAVDLDNLSAQQNYERATQFNPPPSFAVRSSPSKLHVYWQTQQHDNHDRFTLLQRKLAQYFDGDKSVIDPSRVLRLPGFFHRKAEPHLITCWALSNYDKPIDPGMLEIALATVDVTNTIGGRHELGEPSLSAPSMQWALEALRHANPNAMDRGEWIAFTAAWKQAAWLHDNPDAIRTTWLQWCERYANNDPKENLKNWDSLRATEGGWQSVLNKIPSLKASFYLGGPKVHQSSDAPPMPHQQQQSMSVGELLTDSEQREWFKGCYFVTSRGEILTPEGSMNPTKFNGAYGGKKFVIDTLGKTVNKPWEAATNSTLWTIPKVNRTRFLPDKPFGEIITDQLGRRGVNTYKPATIDARPGDITPFTNHLCAMIPDEHDRSIILDYLAHNIKFPGFKIPWAPLIQSTEGIGKNLFKLLMRSGVGENYVHEPNSKELLDSGTKFNAWLREKLFIIADEIKVGEKRDLVETLKTLISEEKIDIQGKGVDQAMDDNVANWLFFSNHKDAIPINKNGRRYAIFFSALQSRDDLLQRGMDDQYFTRLFDWMRADGAAHVVYWLQHRSIERGMIPMRAPDTTSKAEAIKEGRTVLETIILQMIRDELNGCRKGWISAAAVKAHWPKDRKTPLDRDIEDAIRNLGYHYRVDANGRPIRKQYGTIRGYLFSLDPMTNVDAYVSDQNESFIDGTPVTPPHTPMPGQSNVVALRTGA